MTNWVSRDRPPSIGKKVLLWGSVPTTAQGNGGMFLGDGTFNGVSFSHDGTGHCGLVRVTHWAEIGQPEVTQASKAECDAWRDGESAAPPSSTVIAGQFFVHVGGDKVPLTPELLKAIAKPGHLFNPVDVGSSGVTTGEFAKVLTKGLGEMSPSEKFKHFASKG